ncbi:MAG: hypothetical protein DMF98_23190 [Acidobacteria bacterium]|nr:MAG: hypothetical protein DMF98_23190 [Acidobacteriota bacterium]
MKGHARRRWPSEAGGDASASVRARAGSPTRHPRWGAGGGAPAPVEKRRRSIEYDPARAKVAADNLRSAGLADVVTVVPGDAFVQIPKVPGDFDFVFLDAWKRDYKRFFDLVLPRLEPRGLLLAHNVVNKQAEMHDFLDAITRNPKLFTTIVSPSSEGMSVSVKLK